MRRIGIALAALALVYVALVGAFYIAMLQPPDRFGAIMSRVPMAAMVVLPFKPLWMSARAGNLAVGDAAPDFALKTIDRGRTVKLSGELREKPVALIFGSYT